VPETSARAGPDSPISTAASARSAATGPSPLRSTPLSRPPAIRTSGRGKERSAAITASGWVPCESLTNRTRSTIATCSRRCSTPAKPPAAARIGVRCHAEQEGRSHRSQSVRNIVLARNRKFGDGQNEPARARFGHSSSRDLEPPYASGNDPAVLDSHAARSRLAAPVGDHRCPSRFCVSVDDRVVGVQHQRAAWVDQLGQTALDLPVRLERAVTVQVIGRDVRVDGDRRAARQGRQLELGQLDYDAMLSCEFREPLDERDADVAAEDDRVGRIGRQQSRDQRRRRRLSLGSGHPDRRAGAHPQDEVRLADERRGARGIRPMRLDHSLQGRPQARLGRGKVGVDAR
jgi:hypothetical protein